MATLNVYAIRDTKGENFSPPWLHHTHGTAERHFKTMKSDTNHPIAQFPQDYDLYHLGTFNESNGKMDLRPAPEHLLNADNLPK